MPQFIAVGLTNPSRLSGEHKLSMFGILSLWAKSDPTVTTGASVPGFVHWLIVAGVLLAVLAVVVVSLVGKWRWANDPQRKRGLAPLREVVR